VKSQQRPPERRPALRIAQYLALGLGITLLAVYGIIRLHGVVGQRADMRAFEEARDAVRRSESPVAAVAGGDPRTLPGDPEPDTSLWSEGRIEAFHESLAHDSGIPMAVLHIPAIELSVSVLPGTDELTLNRAVGHIPGTAAPGEPGNIGIAGHRDGFFRGLKDVQAGDELRLETVSGTVSYEIRDMTVVEPERVDVLDPTAEPTLTLVTCYPFYFVGSAPQRFIVTAVAAGDATGSDAVGGEGHGVGQS
jgi:sortase A